MESLAEMGQELISDGNAQSSLSGMYTPFRASVPQLYVDINRDRVNDMNIPLNSVFSCMQVFLGSAYINDFTLFGRVFKVKAAAIGEARCKPEQIKDLYVRSGSGEMIPMGTFSEIEEILGPQTLTRYNMYPSLKIMGQPSPGYSSGRALEVIENMCKQTLPPTMGYEWTELSYQEKMAGSTGILFVFAVILVYLVLSAQYESWTIPLSVCLAVPTALLGAVIGVTIRSMDNNVYTQIGIVLLIGLATKNAILIVEFAKDQRESGMSIFESALSAARLRFRAVLMTAFSFILGVIPLVVASGAGAESRKVLGTVVFAGMLISIVISLICVPMLFFIIQTMKEKFIPQPANENRP